VGKRLVVFYSSFVEEDGHGILYCDGINVFKGIFDGKHRHFEISLE
jgi:hypothetical protein